MNKELQNQVKVLELIVDKAGIYGCAYKKDTQELIYLSPMMQEYFENVKLGDKYSESIPVKHLFGDGDKDTKGLIYDPCEDGIWFSSYTMNIKSEENEDIVAVFCIPTENPKDMILVKQEEI